MANAVLPAPEPDWRDPVRDHIIQFFGDCPSVLNPVILYLDFDENAQSWRTLHRFLGDERRFKDYVRKLASKLRAGEGPALKAVRTFGFAGMAHAWSKLPPEAKVKILSLTGENLALDGLSTIVDTVGGTNILIAWSAVYWGYKATTSFYAFCNGEISGVDFATTIAESFATALAGFLGSTLGASLGMFLAGPLGSLIGAYLGGKISSENASGILRMAIQSATDTLRRVSGTTDEMSQFFGNVESEIGRRLPPHIRPTLQVSGGIA